MSDTMGIRFVGDAAYSSTSNDFAMYTVSGNTVVAQVVGLVSLFLSQVSAEAAADALADGLAKIAETYPEVRDTMVRETIFSALEAQWRMFYGDTAALAGAL